MRQIPNFRTAIYHIQRIRVARPAGRRAPAGGEGRLLQTKKLGSRKFYKIGPATAYMADYPGCIAPKSPQKPRLGSSILSEPIANKPFKLAQCSQVFSFARTLRHDASGRLQFTPEQKSQPRWKTEPPCPRRSRPAGSIGLCGGSYCRRASSGRWQGKICCNINQPRPAPIRYTRLYTRASPRRR